MLQHRAEVDATITFGAGGELRTRGYRLDVPHADVTRPEIAELLLTAVGLRDVERVEVTGVRIFAEPAPVAPAGPPRTRLVELSHVIKAGMTTLPGLPAPAIESHVADLEPLVVAGHAVLLHTGGDRHWGTAGYAVDAPYLTGDGAAWLVEHGAALVGIDSVNIDDMSPASAGERPAHTRLLAAGIPIVEHLTNLGELPPTGARFTATPPRIVGFGTFPVRAYATAPHREPHDHTRSAGRQPTRS